jgi:hypothetical protein
MRVSGHRVPDGCVRRDVVFVSVNQVLVRLWMRVPGTGSGAMACVGMTRRSALSARAVARRSMACLTGKCVLRGMAAPVIGGEGSEALCERLIGSAAATLAQAVGVKQDPRQSCCVRRRDRRSLIGGAWYGGRS